jgi:hypothetical protein
MWAIILSRPIPESAIIEDDRDKAIDRAILLAAAEHDFFNPEVEGSEEEKINDLKAHGNLLSGDYRIDLIRAFRG